VTDQLLLVSRIALLALVYLVFLRVARAVIVEIRAETRANSLAGGAPQSAPSRVPVTSVAASSRSTAAPTFPSDQRGHRLNVLAPDSMAGQSFALAAETTIGRAPGCAVSIDDARISKLHARLFGSDGEWFIEDLGSTNGTIVNGRPLTGPQVLQRGATIQVGEVTLEFS